MEKDIINYLRYNSALMVTNAKSGHPGVCLGASPIAYSIYKNAFVDPCQPNMISRDRIVFSAGHASALIYSCLNLFGYDISVDDLKNFRQLKSITTGHPEVNVAPGVDVSTGPLGQGIANAVGLAIAEMYFRNKFKKGNLSPVDNYTFCFTGDGCLMEGVAQEAISIAGNLKLNKLILLYDKNDITIEGNLSIANTEDTKLKFLACNWDVLEVEDGNNISAIDNAIIQAKKSIDKPTIIIIKTKIGFGSHLEGSNQIHGKPLDREQLNILRQNLDYFVPDWEKSKEVEESILKLKQKKEESVNVYKQKLMEYKTKYPKEYQEFCNIFKNKEIDLASFCLNNTKDMVSNEKFDCRDELHKILNFVAKDNIAIIGGCADVAPSTKAYLDEGYFSSSSPTLRNIPFGIREHAMGAISNGIGLYGGLMPFCSTYFCFENYLTPAIRMSAMSKIPVLYLFTHDSICVGEDGPTHQSIEQIATLRCMPDINVFRPCSRAELTTAFEYYVNKKEPVVLVMPRQVTKYVIDDYSGSKKGGYVVYGSDNYDLSIIATGSEVSLAIEVAKQLAKKNIVCRVVSMHCVSLFESQSADYKNKVVDNSKPVFCIEASSDNIWFKYATNEKTIFDIHHFGMSGKAEDVYKYFGFEVDKITEKILKFLKQ